MDLSKFNIQNSSEYFSDLEKRIIWGFTYKKGYYRSVYFLDDLYIYLL